MNELQLKYGCNPNQKPSRIYMEDGSDLPSYFINLCSGSNTSSILSAYSRTEAVNTITSQKEEQ